MPGLYSVQPRNQPMTNEEKQIEEKLQELTEEVLRNERQMRKAFMRYEDLICENANLVAGIDALLAFREERRRNSLKMLLNSKLVSGNGGQSGEFGSADISSTASGRSLNRQTKSPGCRLAMPGNQPSGARRG